MSTAKTSVDTAAAARFLEDTFAYTTTGLTKIEGGELAEAFFFAAEGADYVLRIHSRSTGFIKDRYAFEHFRTAKIPIPRIIRHGRFDRGHFYAISERAPGSALSHVPPDEHAAAVPSVLETLDAIHHTDVSHTAGFGYWRGSGFARRKSARAHVEASMARRSDLFARPYVDHSFHLALWKRVRSLLGYLPERRYLVHGDYGHDNLIVDNGTVSAVIDWGESAYGDFMHDVAWLDFWSDLDYGAAARERYERAGTQVADYEERLILHELAIASGALAFYVLSAQEAAYRDLLARLQSMRLGL